MTTNRQQTLQDVLVFALLVAIGVTGRWGQPIWAFTPIAAATVFAGFCFSRVAVAAMVPIAILGISDLLLPAYDSLPVLIATYLVMTAPLWFGRLLRNENRTGTAAWKLAVCGLVPATVFFVVTNFFVWAFQSDYEASIYGLVECFARALPFYRWMLAGDVFYVAVFAGCWLLANAGARQVGIADSRE